MTITIDGVDYSNRESALTIRSVSQELDKKSCLVFFNRKM